MTILLIITAFTSCLILFGFIEYQQHQKYLNAIPLRIHVNGTRGKSSVTRLIGAGLRAGGYNTITKVTGTYPRMILNDGTEVAIHRKEKANILEQLNIVKYCSKNKADVLLIECMALQPNFQRITEHQMIRSTHGVITNIRMDHTDVMGPHLENIAEAISLTIPKKSKLFTSEIRMLEFLKKKANELETEIISTTGDTVMPSEMKGFAYFEHPENVSLALSVCKSLGVKKKIALDAMKMTIPDEGALKKFILMKDKKIVHFYNALAANDPESSIILWDNIQKRENTHVQKNIILNSRKDRKERSEQLISSFSNLEFENLILTGENNEFVRSVAIKRGISKNKIYIIGQKPAQQQVKEILPKLGPESLVVAFGNMGAGGAELSKYVEQNSENNIS